MKKHLLLLFACVCIASTATAEEFLLPDYDGIQALGKSDYDVLLGRFQAIDTTLSIRDFQTIYYGSAFYGNPSSGVNGNRLNAIMNTNGNDGIIQYLDSVLAESPLNLGALRNRFIAAYIAKDTTATRNYLWQYDRLVDAIFATGDALKETTALHVVCINDEYTIMNYVMQVNLEQQSLLSSMCDKMDIVTKNGTKMSVYFDVQLVLALESRMFSTSPEPFKFKYKKK